MSDVSRAVFYSCEEVGLSLSLPLLVINDNLFEIKSRFPGADFWNPETQMQPKAEKYKSVLLMAPKQKSETRYLLSLALQQIEENGVLAVAATNDAGGKSLGKILKEFDLEITDVSKHKCRVVWTVKPQEAHADSINQALKQGGLQQRQDGLWSQPGVFSWEELDKGTALILPHVERLSGKGADFGCGIGVIGLKLLENTVIKKLICIDRDIRALQACEKNLTHWKDKIEIRQADLSKPVDLCNLDFIVMNPPFHTGKKETLELGKSFIINASSSLKTSGILLMVANNHLPYEELIGEKFSSHRIVREDKGFKIIEAIK